MNATGLYCSASRIIFQADTNAPITDQRLPDLYRLVPYLRQSLSCAVCGRLLSDPYVTKDGKCQHNVCRLCVRGRKNIKPSCFACKDCQDFRTYEENRQMRCLLQCYKSLCEHLMSTPLYPYICKQKIPTSTVSCGITIPNLSLVEFIVEGANFEDVLLAFATDLPKTYSKYAQLTSANIVQQQEPLAAFPPPNNAVTVAVTPSTTTQQLPALTPVQSSHKSIQMPPLVIKQEYSSPPTAVAVMTTTTAVAATTTTTLPPTIAFMSNSSGLTVSSSSPNLNSTKLMQTATKPMFTAQQQQQQQQQHRNVINISTTSATTTHVDSKTPTIKVAPWTKTTACPQIRNPPPIKTVSNGSAMYSVLYTGIGNKITIKRKTDGDDDNSLRKNIQNSQQTPPTVLRPVSKQSPKRRGCRCGNATPTPGKLTCCGQRCPCYVDSKSCINCKCRGCRNPHRPDGGKVRPIIPELACYEIQMADDSTNLNPNDLPIVTTTTTTTMTKKPIVNSLSTATTSSLNRIELPLDDFSKSRINVAVQQGGSSLNNNNNNNNKTVIPINKTQQTLTYTTGKAQTTLQQQPQQQQLQLENLSRESLLIQSSKGNYQVVNVFTAAAPNQNAGGGGGGGLPRIHSVSSNSNNLSNLTGNNSFIIPITTHHNSLTRSPSTSSASLHQIPEISTTLPQIIMQQQNQQQQQQQQNFNRVVSSSSSSSTSQQQQQQQYHHNLKTNNIITVHPLTQNALQQHQKRSHHHMQSLSSSSISPTPPTTITLSPIIVSASPNNFSPDLFPDDDYLANTTSSTGSIASNCSTIQSHMIMATTTSSENSPISIATSTHHHPPPPHLELVEASDF